MVSSGQVNSDLSSITSALSQYTSCVTDLSSSWKGDSFDNLSSKASEFSSEYTSSLTSQFNAFASTCDLYEQYKTAKQNKANAQTNYNNAVASDDKRSAAGYSSDITKYDNEMNNLKSQIESQLSTASGVKLEATSISLGSISGATSSDGSVTSESQARATSSSQTIQSAMDWAIGIANDDSHGYSQNTRYGNPNYDCSSLVIAAYEAAGVPVKEAGAGYTGNMRSAFTSVGFTWIPGQPNMANLQPGDVLLDENTHAEMYVGNGQNVGAHSNYDGVDGDSSGKEINIQAYSNHHWDGVLRYEG